MKAVAETPRLILDRLRPSDIDAFLAYRNDPEVARYQSWERITFDEASRLIASQSERKPGEAGDWSQFAIRLKGNGRLVGDCGLHVDGADPRLGEIGFTFARDHQGLGLAREAVDSLVRFAFETLALHRIKAIVDCRNAAAARLLERLGFRREGHFVQHAWFKGAWCDEYLYAVLRSEWMSKSRAPERP